MLYLNGQSLDITVFPDKTSQVWKLPESELHFYKRAIIYWDYASESEFLHLAQLKTLLDHFSIDSVLFIEYLPYGRQDKPVSNTSTFGLVTFARLLNCLNFTKISITDPHSPAAINLIKNSVSIYPHKEFNTAFFDECKSELACYPDKGAKEKYHHLHSAIPFIYGEKVRDQLIGHITSYKLVGQCEGKSIMIIDDICDGGATFQLLAKDLLGAGAKEVNLFVTHGIFSKGLEPLFNAGIKRIFTKNGEVTL